MSSSFSPSRNRAWRAAESKLGYAGRAGRYPSALRRRAAAWYEEQALVEEALGQLLEYNAMVFLWKDEIGDPSKYVSEADLDYYYSRLGERRDCDFLITDTEAQAEGWKLVTCRSFWPKV